MQIVGEIISRIVSGTLKPGQRLPSTRDLAVEAGVNLNTSQRAYTELEAQQVLITQRGNGRFVVDDCELLQRLKKDIFEKEISLFADKMKSLGIEYKAVSNILEKYMTEED